MISKSKIYNLIIFGAKGDLARRKLFPALYQLEKKNKLINKMKIIGVSRSCYHANEYNQLIYNSLKNFLQEEIEQKIWNKLIKRLIFCQMDINKIEDFRKLKKILKYENNFLINYFAVASDMFLKICRGLKSINFNKNNSKIILEKPIGNSLKTFNFINVSIKKYFNESQIFRIDHYLAKEALLNLISLKFANPFFNNNLNHHSVDHIQITLSESLGVEERWNYFDKTGQIIDMVQNHILQIISIFSMNAPKSLTSYHISQEKIKILKSLKIIDKTNIHDHVSLGQYAKGNINNKKVFSYLDEKNSNKTSSTETFVAIKMYVDNKTWRNTPFYIRTGKRLPKKCSKIVVFFKKKIKHLFSQAKIDNFYNCLTINLQQPMDITIKFLHRAPTLNSNLTLKPCKLNFNYKKYFQNDSFFEEYEKLLLAGILGDRNLFIHEEEIIYAWKWIDPLITACQKNLSLLQYYSSGTWGPKSSQNLIEKDKKKWNNS